MEPYAPLPKSAEYREIVWLIFHPHPQRVSTNSTLKFWPMEKHLRLFTYSILRDTSCFIEILLHLYTIYISHQVIYRNKVAPSYREYITYIHASSFASSVYYYYGFIMLVLTRHEFGVPCYHNKNNTRNLELVFFPSPFFVVFSVRTTVCLNILTLNAVKVFQL